MRRTTGGQTIVEAALVLPMVLVLLLGSMQCVLLAYGAALARFAAFAALRASATAASGARPATARAAAFKVLSGVPAVTMLDVATGEVPLPLRGASLAAPRMTCTVVARVPRLVPLRLSFLSTVRASAAMPMEPAR